jgi:cardiolipin-specific phospholipase
MGNYWKGISDDDLSRAEVNLLMRAGLQPEDFTVHNVRLGDDAADGSLPPLTETDSFIHCIEVQNTELTEEERAALPIMVLIHGYGAGGGVFFRVIKDLSRRFHLYVVDMLGMGASGRPEYKAFTVDLAEDFFVESLKTWKEKMKIREKFYLAGHSLGGYVSTVYALRYPEDLIKLLLLSPVGVPEKPDDFTHEEVAQRFDSFKGRMGARVVLKLWEMNVTPFGPLRFTGSYATKAFLKFYLGRRMKSITHEEELEEMKAYLHQIFLRPASGEYALNTILQPGSWAKNPLIYRLP